MVFGEMTYKINKYNYNYIKEIIKTILMGVLKILKFLLIIFPLYGRDSIQVYR